MINRVPYPPRFLLALHIAPHFIDFSFVIESNHHFYLGVSKNAFQRTFFVLVIWTSYDPPFSLNLWAN